jgi:hypothetical protein
VKFTLPLMLDAGQVKSEIEVDGYIWDKKY